MSTNARFYPRARIALLSLASVFAGCHGDKNANIDMVVQTENGQKAVIDLDRVDPQSAHVYAGHVRFIQNGKIVDTLEDKVNADPYDALEQVIGKFLENDSTDKVSNIDIQAEGYGMADIVARIRVPENRTIFLKHWGFFGHTIEDNSSLRDKINEAVKVVTSNYISGGEPDVPGDPDGEETRLEY